ncbi:MAG: pseudouridine-5'-phosphate glycosidase, partial [Anaerolineales bacterium]
MSCSTINFAESEFLRRAPISPTPSWLEVHGQVASALQESRPVVALESSLITHGLPRPLNGEVAQAMEAVVRAQAATPATIAVLKGKMRVGLTPEELDGLAQEPHAWKATRRDLAACRASGATAGTTVAATAYLAHRAGIQVFATGGIGGVHRGPIGDVSADLPALADTPIAVVCSG